MAENNYRVIPGVKRVTEFTKKDRSQQVYDLSSPQCCDSDVKLVDGCGLVEYTRESPIVHYCCDENSSIHQYGGARLNYFVKSITVSKADGRKVGLSRKSLYTKEILDDTFAYYTDNTGTNHVIIQHDLYSMLLQKPNLIVSPEGVLVFFTDKDIIATVDCNSGYQWISGNVINLNGNRIKNIEVCDDCCKIIIAVDDNLNFEVHLKFEIDMLAYQLLKPVIVADITNIII